MSEVCRDCGLPRPAARHIIDLPDMLLPTGHCGALLHPVWAESCAERHLERLRAQLSAALAKVAELTSQLENALDASMEGGWMARALDAERESARLQKLLDVCSEVHGHNVRLHAERTELRAERDSAETNFALKCRELSLAQEENARLRREVEDVVALDEWQAPGSGHNVELASGANHQACYLHGWDGDVIHKATGATLPEARRAAVEYLQKGGKDG